MQKAEVLGKVVDDIWELVFGAEPKRAIKKGRYVADDPSTPDVDEAYTTVEVKKERNNPSK